MKYVSKDVTCRFTPSKGKEIDYKNIPLLLEFVDYFGRIKKSYYKGTNRKYQLQLAKAIKRARHMGLLAFVR